MKYGLLIYESYNSRFNIGDYIQGLAAKQFLKEPIIYINREKLDQYKGEKIKMILNGWFLHESDHWPPSEEINPTFVSFHLNSVAYEILDDKKKIDYFKKHEPIGCRDKKTRDLLINKGINAFFSGCLTLTLSKTYKLIKERSNKVYFVDPYYSKEISVKKIISILKMTLLYFPKIIALTKKMFNKLELKNYYKAASFFMQYKSVFEIEMLLNSDYLTHIVDDTFFKNENDKFSYAEELLFKYAEAKLVITSRIHCALPCLSLETPVLYTDASYNSETSACRLDGIKELFHILSVNTKTIKGELMKENQKINSKFSFKNKDKYIKLKNGLINSLKDF